MKNRMRWIAIGVAGAVGLVLLAFAAYDVLAFQPRRADIARIVAQAAPEERAPPTEIRRLVGAAFGDDARACARVLLDRFGADAPRRNWRERLWALLLHLHVEAEDRTAVLLALTPTGTDRTGLAATAATLYGRPLAALSLDESAELVALMVTPAAEDDPALLSTLKIVLLTRYVSS